MLENALITLQQFHFIRPNWLLLLLPLPLLLGILIKQRKSSGLWQKVIDPKLAKVMLNSAAHGQHTLPSWPVWLTAWLIAVVALAGPTFTKMPQPVVKNQQALIILLDMSASMAATDIKPSRATRAVQKITDILRARPDGLTGLIVYAGDAHTVTPLTTDTRTITSLLPALSPFIMPSPGSRPDKAVQLARTLAANSGVKEADILLITDNLLAKDAQRLEQALRPGLNLKIIAIGSSEGAPVPLPTGGFLRDGQGQIVVPKLDLGTIKSISQDLNVPWRSLSLDDSDWQTLLSATNADNLTNNLTHSENSTEQFDLWRDDGYWLILLILPLSLLLFRRGALLCLPLVFWLAQPQPALATPWQTADQQGAALFNQDPATAAQTFKDPAWRASAHYKAGDYAKAVKDYQSLPKSAENRYNLGNALAQNGQLKEAISAYDNALALNPKLDVAQKNKALVEQLLKQQEQKNNDQNQQKNNEENSEKNTDQNNDQSKNQENNNQENNDQENSHEQGQSDKSSNQQNDQEPQNNHGQQNNADNSDDSADNTEQNSAENTEQNSEQEAKDNAQQHANKNTEEQEAKNEEQEDGIEPATSSGLNREEQEAMDKWLKQVPDNPGNLLQRKFLYQYRQRANADYDQGDAAW